MQRTIDDLDDLLHALEAPSRVRLLPDEEAAAWAAEELRELTAALERVRPLWPEEATMQAPRPGDVRT